MRSSVKVQHLAVLILFCIAMLPVHVFAVVEKDGEGQVVKAQVNDTDEEILDYIVRFEDTKSYQSFLETKVQTAPAPLPPTRAL